MKTSWQKNLDMAKGLVLQIIDEASTLPGTDFAKVHDQLMRATKSNKLFGGVLKILVTDFAQLPPCKRESLCNVAM